MTAFMDHDYNRKGQAPDYVVVFGEEADGNETRFRATSDDEATELTHRHYPDRQWTLFRIAGNERWHVHIHPGKDERIPEHIAQKMNPENRA